MAPIRNGNANTARTPAAPAPSRKAGQHSTMLSCQSFRSAVRTGELVLTTSMHGPSPRSSIRPESSSVTHTRPPVARVGHHGDAGTGDSQRLHAQLGEPPGLRAAPGG